MTKLSAGSRRTGQARLLMEQRHPMALLVDSECRGHRPKDYFDTRRVSRSRQFVPGQCVLPLERPHANTQGTQATVSTLTAVGHTNHIENQKKRYDVLDGCGGIADLASVGESRFQEAESTLLNRSCSTPCRHRREMQEGHAEKGGA